MAELLEKLNHRRMRRLKKSRRELFEEIERVVRRPPPVRPYEYAEWAQPKADLSYHVEHDDHFYSVHFPLIGEQLDLRATEATVEIFRRGTRIESYPRSYAKRKYTTLKHHMPRAHLDQVEWTPEHPRPRRRGLAAPRRRAPRPTADLIEAKEKSMLVSSSPRRSGR